MNNTIKLFAFALVISLVSVGGCLKKFTTVNFDYHTDAVIHTNALTTMGFQTFGDTFINSGLRAELEANGTSIDNLDELKLRSVVVTFENDSISNFDLAEKIEFYLEADGNPEVLIASKNPVLDGQNSVTLDVNNNENLANYIKANQFFYRIKGVNSAPIQPLALKVFVIWTVKASAK